MDGSDPSSSLREPGPKRQTKPAPDCNASKEELLNKKRNPLEIDDDCPICRETCTVLCFVGNHPTCFVLPSADSNTKEFHVSVSFGKTHKMLTFTSDEHFIDLLEFEWKSLRQFKYEILVKSKSGIQKFNSINQLRKDSKIIIRTLSKGFSKFQKEEEVLQYVNALMMSSDFFAMNTGDPDFPVISSDVISNDILCNAARAVLKELQLRRDVIEIEHAIEYSMREFISPILIASVKMMIDHLRGKKIVEKLSLCCEKKIIGNMYFGPVDYSVVFDCLDIVLTEAKRGSSELKAGILQNLLQQRSAKEFLAKVVVEPTLPSKQRKRKYEENLHSLMPLPSFGIVSDGTNWIFTKTIFNPRNGKTCIIKSSSYNVLPNPTEENMKNLISRILGIIHVQLQEINYSQIYQEFKLAKIQTREGTLSREVTIAVETMQEMKTSLNQEVTEGDDFVVEEEEDEEEDL